jgi:hypothetical protein
MQSKAPALGAAKLGSKMPPQMAGDFLDNEMLNDEDRIHAQRRYSDPQDQPKPLVPLNDDLPPAARPLPAAAGKQQVGKMPGTGAVSEDEMIEIAQRCFFSIAEQMAKKQQTIHSVFQDVIFKKTIEGEEVELVTPLDFLSGLRQLGIEDLQTVNYTCLIKVLAVNEEEKHIRINDLVQILEDYGIVEQDSVEERIAEELKFEDLDKVSIVLMLALTEYLIKAKVPLYELFRDVIFKQEIQVEGKQLRVDLIKSTDFFAVLQHIGINIEEKEHENLNAFLCLDPGHTDKLLVKKIKRAIEEFAMNEQLRAYAQQIYQELVEEEQPDDPQAASAPSGPSGPSGPTAGPNGTSGPQPHSEGLGAQAAPAKPPAPNVASQKQ